MCLGALHVIITGLQEFNLQVSGIILTIVSRFFKFRSRIVSPILCSCISNYSIPLLTSTPIPVNSFTPHTSICGAWNCGNTNIFFDPSQPDCCPEQGKIWHASIWAMQFIPSVHCLITAPLLVSHLDCVPIALSLILSCTSPCVTKFEIRNAIVVTHKTVITHNFNSGMVNASTYLTVVFVLFCNVWDGSTSVFQLYGLLYV